MNRLVSIPTWTHLSTLYADVPATLTLAELFDLAKHTPDLDESVVAQDMAKVTKTGHARIGIEEINGELAILLCYRNTVPPRASSRKAQHRTIVVHDGR